MVDGRVEDWFDSVVDNMMYIVTEYESVSIHQYPLHSSVSADCSINISSVPSLVNVNTL